MMLSKGCIIVLFSVMIILPYSCSKNPSGESMDWNTEQARSLDKEIVYNGPNNTDPETIIFGLSEMISYTGDTIKFCTTNLFNPEVREYHQRLFEHWIDPNGDCNFSDGVDGYRIVFNPVPTISSLGYLLPNVWETHFLR